MAEVTPGGTAPSPTAEPEQFTMPAHGIMCFHCWAVFTTEDEAREHFGPSECADPGCRVDIAAFRALEEDRNHWRSRALSLDGTEEMLDGLRADMRGQFGTLSLWDIADRLSNERFRAEHAMKLLEAAGIAFDQLAPTVAR